uniref:Uncharacterized protein n=1 Tax=Acrobeloides nanus TaxID=290746 RepID=A0A914ELE3_9BILA
MSTLSDLINAADSPAPSARTTTPAKVKGHGTSTEDAQIDPVDEILSGRSENQFIPETPLGIAVDNFGTNWNELLCLINTTVGHTQPSLDHLKEVAECSAKNLKDACLELSGEFTRASLQWRLNKREEAMAEDTSDFEAAIGRQQTLIARTEGLIASHLSDFANSNTQPKS